MKHFKLLYVQVLIGLVLGIIFGFIFPNFADTGKLMSDMFINMIKMIIGPIIFMTIVNGIAGAGDLNKVGRVGGKGFLYFEIVTTIGLILGLLVGIIFKPGVGLNIEAIPKSNINNLMSTAQDMSWSSFIYNIVPSNVFESFTKGDLLQILFFAILFSFGLSKLNEKGKPMVMAFEKINAVLFNIIHIVMKLSPIAAFAGMTYTIGKFGFGTLLVLGKFMIAVYLTSFLFIVVILGSISRFYGFSLWKLLVYMKEEILISLGSSSSESVLPNVMEKLEIAGCEKSVVGLIVPTGYSFNLDGTTIYLSLATIFLAQIFNINLSLLQQLSIIGLLMITSKGAAGVSGSGFIVLTSTLTILKIIPLEGLALLVGIDRIMSQCRSITNLIGNIAATVIIAKSENAVDESRFKKLVG
ncbi:C4-dicarboxylate transporter DctA [Daejeonella sp.]|uniref:C4-dicarboxylate transporter DctA n=1 Tax=Daejeonella sp. TaxID=2805397 RepID=UPI0037852DBA